ncbi:MAG: hypothetical protein HZC40_08945 [Chloroflexi bacterium]|nr:hypothetical protein [Chloroflexota bacterium]
MSPRLRVILLALALTACEPITIPRVQDATNPPPPTPITKSAPTSASATARAPQPTPTLEIPDGGAITLGVVGSNTLEMNVMPEFLQDALFDSLLQIDPATGALKPGLAEAFQVSADATTFTFRLRADVRWHTGAPFTADDVIATINAFASPSFRGAPVTDFGANPRATALDNQTVQMLALSANFPRLTTAQLIGTGALKFVARNGDAFTLERNADYFRGAPHIETWTVRVFPDFTTARAAFIEKQIDLLPAAPGDYRAIKNFADAQISATDARQIVMLILNADTLPLNDARVRQAFNYAIDRNILISDLAGQARVIDAATLPGFWANPNTLPRYAYDPAKAKQILADAGWVIASDGIAKKNGKPLKLDLWMEADDPILEPLAFRLREMYAAVGIQTQLQLNDRPGWMTRAFAHRFDLLLITRALPLDPDQRWYWQASENVKGNGFNFGSYASARVDALIKDSLRVNACEPSKRAAIFGDIQRELAIDAPAVFLLAPKKYLVARDRVLGVAPSSFAGDFWNLNQLGVK